jgi:hypothetical protein
MIPPLLVGFDVLCYLCRAQPSRTSGNVASDRGAEPKHPRPNDAVMIRALVVLSRRRQNANLLTNLAARQPFSQNALFLLGLLTRLIISS